MLLVKDMAEAYGLATGPISSVTFATLVLPSSQSICPADTVLESRTMTLPLLARCKISPTSCNYTQECLMIDQTFCQLYFSLELDWVLF